MLTFYNNIYLNDPATDNHFGDESLSERSGPALLAHLRAGGSILTFPRAVSGNNVIDMLDRALAIPGALK